MAATHWAAAILLSALILEHRAGIELERFAGV
jgi:hypothetical protein